MNDLDQVVLLDRELVEIARNVKVLSNLTWDPLIQPQFLDGWRRNNPQLPKISYPTIERTAQQRALEKITTRAASLDHPFATYIEATARSYLKISRLLENVGSPAMTDLSIAVYGRPGDPLTGGKGTTSLDAAKFFLNVAREFYAGHQQREAQLSLPAHVVKDKIVSGLSQVFEAGRIRVEIDANLASKAAAASTRIRLRDATCYSEYDAEQLLQHEAFVHSLTSLNGLAQPHLRSMSLSAPRTTAAQEGLATFAELVTGAIDIARLERIAMRIVAIDAALAGADFIDVFRYFLDAGQPESESFNSSMRVFRGAPLSGGHAFTKDSVYLHGLLEVHTFFRWALREQKLDLAKYFFSGRMTLGDVIRFEPFFRDGTLSTAHYLPPWMTRTTGLGGYLAFSVFANNIDLSELYAEHDFKSLDR